MQDLVHLSRERRREELGNVSGERRHRTLAESWPMPRLIYLMCLVAVAARKARKAASWLTSTFFEFSCCNHTFVPGGRRL